MTTRNVCSIREEEVRATGFSDDGSAIGERELREEGKGGGGELTTHGKLTTHMEPPPMFSPNGSDESARRARREAAIARRLYIIAKLQEEGYDSDEHELLVEEPRVKPPRRCGLAPLAAVCTPLFAEWRTWADGALYALWIISRSR